MSKPMTLREAVQYLIDGYDITPQHQLGFDKAKLIVDAAVEFVEARSKEWDGYQGSKPAIDLFYKLRALERGEEAKP